MGNVKDYKYYADKLEKRYNIIFHGAPGTGKTYLAKQVAAYMVGGTTEYSKLTDEQKSRIGFVQFHPSYDYTDFVEGLRPVPVNQNSNVSPVNQNSNVGFELKDGIFKEFVDRAMKDCRSSTNGGNDTSVNTSQASVNNSNVVSLKMVDDFLNDSISQKTEFKLKRRENGEIPKFKVIGLEDAGEDEDEKPQKKIVFDCVNPDVMSAYDRVLLKLLNHYKEPDIRAKDVEDYFSKSSSRASSYYRGLYKGFRIWANENGLDNSEDDSLTDQDKTEDGEYIEEPIEAGRKQPEEDEERQEKGKKQNADKKYVFIIDEINRGEISKILGELFFSIDPGYRGEEGSVDTQYANMHTDKDYKFYIPENVYIIGTMNDIDRSVDSFDFAMRRRFSFIEIKADDQKGMLASLGNDQVEAVKRMTALNTAISNENELGSSYEVGPAYFNKVKNMNPKNKWEDLWSDYIEPLLREYVRGLDNDEEDMIKKFKKAYDS